MDKSSRHSSERSPGCDRELFSRVWTRVGPHDPAVTPIEILSPVTPSRSALSTAPAPVPPSTARDQAGTDAWQAGNVPCLGREGRDHSGFLQKQIHKEALSWRTYQSLAARARGNVARDLAAIAADERRHAQRLSAAYFLISGIRFFPQTRSPHPDPAGFWSALRQAFWTKQQAHSTYAAAAEETSDPCLAALYRELAAEEAAHADLLRAAAETMPR